MAEKSIASQEFVPIQEIRDGVVILKDGTMRMVLLVTSVNFSLKSNDEKEALLFQYQNFLNSLDFHIQIFIQSRRLDIKPYITTLEERLKEQTNDLLKTQITEYIQFIKNFTETTNVMNKTFFVVVPFYQAILRPKTGLLGKLFNSGDKQAQSAKETLEFEEQKTQLEQRTSVVEQGLARIGLKTAILGTEELVELYFKIFNPGENEVPTTLGPMQ